MACCICPWLHVIGKCDNKPMSYVAALHFVRNYNYVHNYYGPYAYCSLDKGVAYTGGGGYYAVDKPRHASSYLAIRYGALWTGFGDVICLHPIPLMSWTHTLTFCIAGCMSAIERESALVQTALNLVKANSVLSWTVFRLHESHPCARARRS